MAHKNFSNRIVLITGGSAGIGKACAHAFAKAGAKVIIAARRKEEAIQVVKEIKQNQGEAYFLEADIGQAEAISRLFERISEDFGHLDFAINNAGMLGPTSVAFEELSQKAWNEVIGVNLTGVFCCMQEEIRIMKAQKHGVIVNISSIAGIWSGTASAVYSASKHGVIGLTRYAAKEVGPFNIRINAICPGLTQTAMADDLDDSKRQAAIQRIPMRRIAKPEEIAEAALWLCSDLSAFVTGTSITMDGGLLA